MIKVAHRPQTLTSAVMGHKMHIVHVMYPV